MRPKRAVSTAERARIDAKAASDASERDARAALQSTIENFHREQRAYLVPGEPVDTSGYGLIRFPVLNYGRVTARRIRISTNFQRMKQESNRTVLMDNRDLSTRTASDIPLNTSPAFYMLVFIPQQGSNDYQVELANGVQSLTADGMITYDSGFGETDSVRWCYSWSSGDGRWKSCGGNTAVWLDSAPNTNHEKVEEYRRPKGANRRQPHPSAKPMPY